ncbi:hypothetical protein [Protofrankia coriariae]|uniref:hypothetical protein n=1 Tax=Protofrankia coriariae TaxID=1562887 RepID=UPI00064046B4|nr:hypothetical protein [Protofrankia coriariae]ONH38100.1 hypothetical protein BL254_01340 [Protofrankia sp. BMG5.30]
MASEHCRATLDSAARRAEIRRFVRENHPDRGGDPDVFASGLQALRAQRPPRPACGEVTTYHKRSGLALVVGWIRRQSVRRRAESHRPPRVC